MKTEKYFLWKDTPGLCEEKPTITAYYPENRKKNIAMIIFPGGGYIKRAEHEGDSYAEFLYTKGYTAFVVDYRVKPHKFPLQLLDARRAIRYVRHNAEKFGIDKTKIAVMGSSAGGHLAALVSTYYKDIEFENIDDIDTEEYVPNYQILCYPVISLFGKGITHLGSGKALMGEMYADMCEELSPNLIVSDKTPPAFIWHTFSDNSVSVKNSLLYSWALKEKNIPTELHIFPDGAHGLGLANGDEHINIHVSQWKNILLNWLEYMNG